MELSQYERDILDMECDFQRMSYLERKSRIRLQVISKGKKHFLRSIRDQHATLRIFVTALLLKLYGSSDTKKQQHGILKFKQIVYGSQLQSLTTCRGLYKQQLHKNVAIHLLKLQNCTNIEEELLGCFNCVAFFDEVLMLSFKEHFSLDRGQQIQFWTKIMQKNFSLTIVWSQKLKTSSNDKIPVVLDADQLYLPSNAAIDEEDKEVHSILTSNDESVDKSREFGKNIIQTVSIEESIQSPMLYSANANKQNANRLNCSRKIAAFDSSSSQSPRIKRQPFWSMFCCGSD